MPAFDLKDHAQLRAFLVGKTEPAARRGMLSAGKRIIGVIVTKVIPAEPRVPVDRGLYRAGFRSMATTDGNVLITNIAPHAAIIEHGARAENIKVGRKMIDALAEWVVRKKIGQPKKAVRSPGAIVKAPRAKIGAVTKAIKKIKKALASAVGKSILFVAGVDAEKAKAQLAAGKAASEAAKHASVLINARRIAWAIAMSMKKKGIFNEGKGLHIMAKGMQHAPKIIEEEILREIKRGIGKG